MEYKRIALETGVILYGLASLVKCGGNETLVPIQEPVQEESAAISGIIGSNVGRAVQLGVLPNNMEIESFENLENMIPRPYGIWDLSESFVQEKATLALFAQDIGAGLERAVLYEDGIPFREYGTDDFSDDGKSFAISVIIEKTEAGEHVYVFEATDAADNTAESKPITISFHP